MKKNYKYYFKLVCFSQICINLVISTKSNALIFSKPSTTSLLFKVASDQNNSFAKKLSNGNWLLKIKHSNTSTNETKVFPIRENSIVFTQNKNGSNSSISLVAGGKEKLIEVDKSKLVYINTTSKNNTEKLVKIIPGDNSLSVISEKIGPTGTVTNKLTRLKLSDNSVKKNKVSTGYQNSNYSRNYTKYNGITGKVEETYEKTKIGDKSESKFENNKRIIFTNESNDIGSVIKTIDKQTNTTTTNHLHHDGSKTYITKDGNGTTIKYRFDNKGNLTSQTKSNSNYYLKKDFKDGSYSTHLFKLNQDGSSEEIKEDSAKKQILFRDEFGNIESIEETVDGLNETSIFN